MGFGVERRTTMPRTLIAVSLLALGYAVAGCCATPAPQHQPQAQACRYRLTSGSSIAIATTTDGASTIVVTIPSGSPGAGEYASTAEALVEPAREAKNALNEPGRNTVIDVDAAGRLVAIEQSVMIGAK